MFTGIGKMRTHEFTLNSAVSGTSFTPPSGKRFIIHEITLSAPSGSTGSRVSFSVDGDRKAADICSSTGAFPPHLNVYSLETDQALDVWGDGKIVALNIVAEEIT